MWGSPDTNARGRQINQILNDHSLCLFNNGEPTSFHEPTRTFNAIDLAICSPSLLPLYNFFVGNDLRNSDHFPIFLCPTNADPPFCLPQRYIYRAAKWDVFASCAQITRNMVDCNVDHAIDQVTNVILQAADAAIPKSSSHPCHHFKPWWNHECQETIKQQRRAWRRFRRCPTTENLILFKKARATARRTRRRSQRESWKDFVSRITTSSTSNEVWKRAKRAMGLHTENPISCVKKNGHLLTSIDDISNAIAQHFASVSRATSFSPEFLRYKRQMEQQRLDFRTRVRQPYNAPFTMKELHRSLHNARSTSPGHDEITNILLQHLTRDSLENILYLFNRIWEEHVFPTSWCKAIVIPIPKPGKDPSCVESYRPIALTCCLCKLLERMVNTRLVYILESGGYLSPLQNGFRQGRSAVDNIISLESSIRNAFVMRQHLVSIFFDIEKAYDHTWRYGILRDLHSMNIKGHLPIFIQNFLSHRIFQVRLRGTSSSCPQEGVPQGSVLSVTLFSLKVNGILNQIPPSVKANMYVDDLQISCQAQDMRFIERQLQTTVNKILKWSKLNGFTFSASKTCCVHFCRQRKMHLDPELYLGTSKISVVESAPFLGIQFDKKLTFLQHVSNLRTICERKLNLLKVLSSTSWGADRVSLLRIYRSLVRSKLDYGCPVYGSARNSVLRRLDTVHHTALRICTGAFRTSPVESLYAVCLEPPLELVRQQITLNYYFRLLSHPSHPVQEILLQKQYDRFFVNRPMSIPSLSFRVREMLHELNFPIITTLKNPYFSVPPWYECQLSFLHPFSGFLKSNTNDLIYQQLFAHHRESYSDFTPVYTDGSRKDNHVGYAFVCGSENVSFCLPPLCSVITAEFTAIKSALDYISHQLDRKYIIYSDSQSALAALESENYSHPLSASILKVYRQLVSRSFRVLFCWIPGHVGIQGNERADVAAKTATNVSNHPIAYYDIKLAVKQSIRRSWQTRWNLQINNKLYNIKQTLSFWPSHATRKIDVTLTRLRIGHTRLTHRYLLIGESPPTCPHCGDECTVAHLLISCPALRFEYINFFGCPNPCLSDLLGYHPHPALFPFLRFCGLHFLL